MNYFEQNAKYILSICVYIKFYGAVGTLGSSVKGVCENSIFKISETRNFDKIIWNIAKIIIENFREIPDKFRNNYRKLSQ